MNYFTIKELNDLHYGLVEYGECESTDVIKLSAKLQSLIDNYCDHRNTQQTCQDCGKYV